MTSSQTPFSTLVHFLDRHFLWLLLASYAAAALWPAPGLWARDASVGDTAVLGDPVRLSLPLALLAFLLVNAGLTVRASRLKELLRQPTVLGIGLAANLLVPVAYILGITWLLQFWHNPDEAQTVLVGLALVASMPVAGSSTAWAQKADGDLALSLGLVLFSILLSPLATPLALHAVGLMASGDYAAILHGLAAHGTEGFLASGVALPALAGLAGHWVLGEHRVKQLRPLLKPATTVTLLVLNYANAAVALPQALAERDWDFLTVILVIVVGLCVVTFGAGWGLARLLHTDRARRVSLMFGLGMNNNGTGLVLAATALAAYPQVLLPIICCNLVQHLVAGAVDATMPPRPARIED